MNDPWEVGDVVQLKSSGPPMTVTKCDRPDMVTCTWFDGREVKVSGFPRAALKVSEPVNVTINYVAGGRCQ
jgi:uncharacterized protein YodC (DUF2158 family)